MVKKSTLAGLVCKYLPVVILILELTNQVIELVNKVVNYASSISKLRIFIPEEGETGICAQPAR